MKNLELIIFITVVLLIFLGIYTLWLKPVQGVEVGASVPLTEANCLTTCLSKCQ